MTAQAPVLREHGNSYNIFILVLTIFSLALMVVQILPIDDDTRQLVTLYDNVICIVFLGDFAMNVAGSRPRRAYIIGQRGWLDLLGSIPALGVFPFTALFRLARLSRLARIGKLLSGKNRKELVRDVLENRGQYATFITVLSAGMVLTVASILILQFESQDPDANIQTGGDAIWWGVVTLTTVGYGDRYPVTLLGRLTAVSVMFAGVGIIGALASILASMLVPPPKEEKVPATAAATAMGDATGAAAPGPAGTSAAPAAATPAQASAAPTTDAIVEELASLRAEIAALRASLPAGPP
jgi:voltage-gated potassium channel